MSTFDLLNALAKLELPDGVIGFPTDTVYGMGCLIEKPAAIQKLRHLRGLTETDPLILLGQSWTHLVPYIQCHSPLMMLKAQELMSAYWPGPLTLVLPKSEKVPQNISGLSPTLGIRLPNCRLLQDLLALTPNGILVSTAAQTANTPACTSADSLQILFGNTLDDILADDSALRHSTPSTVIRIEADGSPIVLRGTL